MNDKAGETWRQRRLALVGHDIRSAVGDIVGGLHLIDDSRLDAASLVQLERVRAAGETLDRLLAEATAALGAPGDAHAPSDRSDAPAEPVALLDLLRDLERRWTGHAAAHGLALRCDLGRSLPQFVGLPAAEFERILSNLLANALKYTDRGEIALTAARDEDGTLRFSVRDQGPGFSDAALARLFGYCARPANSPETGTGMGLHIAKRLADQLGGRLVAGNVAADASRDATGDTTDAPRRGAEVTLLLPPESWQAAAGAAIPDALPDLSGQTVLVAEDNLTNQALLMRMLAQLGAGCTLVTDGVAAFEALRAGGFDAALVDIDLPRRSGLDVIAAVRALEGPAARVPILSVTAFVLQGQRERIYAAGADGILAKPVTSLAALGAAYATATRQAAEAPVRLPRGPTHETDAVRADRLPRLLEIAGPEGRLDLLDRLATDLDRASSRLAEGVRAGDIARVRAETHVLISLTGAIGADGALAAMQAANAAAHRGDWTAIVDMHHGAETGLRALVAEVQSAADSERATVDAVGGRAPTADGEVRLA